MVGTSVGGAIRTGSLALLLAAATYGGAGAADLPLVTKAPPAPPPDPSPFWVGIDALAWTVKGDHLPALVTTGTTGVLGAPGTTVLFGDAAVNDGWRAGARITAGYWLDPRHTRGIEASFFDLADASTNFAASSGGTPLLARPFVNAVSGLQDTLLVASPGNVAGSIGINETSRLLGAGALYRQDIGNFGGERISALIGYRYLHSSDRLGISTSSTVVPGGGGGVIIPGTAFSGNDEFDATSDFHGLDLGLTGEFGRGPWSFDWRAKVALGANINTAQINGSSAVVVPGGPTAAFAGDLLALPSNIGNYTHTRFAAVPELELKVGYQLTSQWRLTAGYDVLYWTGVQRAGGLIDTTVNANLIPPAVGGGPNRPQAVFNTTSLLAQGFTFGARYGF